MVKEKKVIHISDLTLDGSFTERDPVLNTLVESAARLCDADGVGINRPQGDSYVFVANYGHSPEFEKLMREHPIVPGPGTVTGRAVIERHAIHIHDVQNDPQYSGTFTEAAPDFTQSYP